MSVVLYFSPTPSHPQSAGNRSRIFNLAKELQDNGHKIVFVYYTQEGLTKEQSKDMQDQWDEFYVIEKTIHPKVRKEGYYYIDDWYQEGLGEEVAQIALKHKVDSILCSYVFQSKILEFLPEYITKIIDTHDKFSNRHLMLKEKGLTPDFFYTVPSQEAIALNRADKIIAIQKKEADFFRTITKTEVYILGHIQAENILEPKVLKTDGLRVGFVGSANSVNTCSLQKFIDIFEQNEKSNNIKLQIAGSICNKVKTKNKNIELLGFVENIDNFYNGVDVVINPLILGTGLKIKTIEALSYSKAVVSTDIGFEGISSTSPLHNIKDLSLMFQELLSLVGDQTKLEELQQHSKKIYTNIISKERENLVNIFTPLEKKPLLIITHIDFWNQNLGSKNRLFDMVQYLLKSEKLLVVYINPKRSNDQKIINKNNLSKNVLFLQDVKEEDVELDDLQFFVQKHSVLKNFVDEKNYKKLATLLQNYSFKKVIIEYIHLSYFLPLFPKEQSYLDTHDIMFKRYETFKKNNEKHWIEITKSQELSIFKEYDYILSIQKHEHMFLKENNINSLLVPYSFKISTVQKKESKKAIVFIGGNTLANQDAINWFLKNIWDLFVPCEYSLEIYGDICNSVQANNKKKIYTKGRVENLQSIYAYKDLIVINPVNIGGGLKIKNVEAICSGLALLTSPQGAFGLEDGINDAFLVADNIDEFKNKLLALMLSGKLREKLSCNALKYANRNFHSDVCYTQLASLIHSNEES